MNEKVKKLYLKTFLMSFLQWCHRNAEIDFYMEYFYGKENEKINEFIEIWLLEKDENENN